MSVSFGGWGGVVSLALLSTCEQNTVFPGILMFIGVSLVQRFFNAVCVLAFLLCCLLPFLLKLECSTCAVFFSVTNIRLDCLLVWILFSGSFLFVYFLFLYFWALFFPSK